MAKTIVTCHGIAFDVEYVHHKALRGAREGHLQLEPDEPEAIEIISVKIDEELLDLIEESAICEMEQTILTDYRAGENDAAYDEQRDRRMLEDEFEK